jgi:SAM-dependent methyltransferase
MSVLATKKNDLGEIFVTRENCISCNSDDLRDLAGGKYSEGKVARFINADSWGVSPMPFIAENRWQFVECHSCSTRFHKSIISPKWQAVLYTEWVSKSAILEFETKLGATKPQARFEQARGYVRHLLSLERLTRSIRQQDALKLLDFGCGWGGFLSMASNFGFEVYGVDADPDRRNRASENNSYIFSALEELPSKTSFHAITLFEVLEHLANPAEILQSLQKKLVKDGVLVLETPDCSGVTGIDTYSEYRAINPLSHINAFTPQSLSRMAKSAGFSPLRRPPANVASEPLRVLKTEIRRLIGRFLKPSTQLYFRKN